MYKEPHVVLGEVVAATSTVEAYKNNYKYDKGQGVTASVLEGKNTSASGSFKRDIDVSWLPAAADTYHISGDINDYVIIDIPSVTIDIPNRNLQAFPYEEVSYFDNMQGSLVYQTFVGRPTHIDHKNSNPIEAKGVHFDSALQYVPGYNVWKIRTLAGFDRTKDKRLVDDILSGRRNGYSMGALVQNFVPLVAGTLISTEYGLLPIEEVISGMTVDTLGSPQSCGGSISQGYEKVNEIYLDSGQKLPAEDTHPIMVLQPDMSLGWKQAKDLEKDDVVAVSFRESSLWPEQLKLEDYNEHLTGVGKDNKVACLICGKRFTQLHVHIRKAHNMDVVGYRNFTNSEDVLNVSKAGTDYKVPSVMTDDLGSLLGYLLSEGTISKDSGNVLFSNSKNSLVADYQKCWNNTFTLAEDGKKRKRPSEFFKYLGVTDSSTHSSKLRVPWSILRAPKSVVTSFLRAFWEGDGSARARENAITFHSSSVDLLRDIQLLLGRLGIPGRIVENSPNIQEFCSYRSSKPCHTVQNGIISASAASGTEVAIKAKRKMFTLYISEPINVNKFNSIVGTTSQERKEDISKILSVFEGSSYPQKLNSWDTKIPGSKELYDLARKRAGGSGVYYNLEDGSKSRLSLKALELKDTFSLSYRHFEKYPELLANIKKIDATLGNRLQILYDMKLTFTTVIKVQKSAIAYPIFCIKEVGSEHNYIANGVIVHNCSNCGKVETVKSPCRCMAMGKGSIIDGRLVYQLCAGVQYFEQSSVDDPADPTALSNSIR